MYSFELFRNSAYFKLSKHVADMENFKSDDLQANIQMNNTNMPSTKLP